MLGAGMKWIQFVLCSFIYLASTTLAGQTIMNVDSLLKLLPKAAEDKKKVNLLIDIGQQFEANDPQKAGRYYMEAGKLSRKLNDKEGEISFINNYTYVLNILGQYDSSLLLNLQAVDLSIALNDSQLLGKAYFNTGTSYKLKGNIEEAAAYYLQGKNIFEKFGNDVIRARASDILQQLYFDMGQYQKAIAFGEQAIALSIKMGDSLLLVSAYSNAGMSYAAIGENERAMNNYRMALATARRTGNGYAEGTVLLNMADILSKRGDEKLTGPLYNQALKITREIDDREGEVVALRGLSNYHLSLRQPSEALYFALASYRIADSLGMRPQLHKTLTSLANVHYALQQIEVARNYTYRANLLADSLNSEALQRNIADLEKKYETQKKDEQLSQQQAALRQQRFFNLALGGLTIFLLLSLLLALRTYRQKQKLQIQRISQLEKEKQLNAAEAVLTGEQQERTRLAKDLHDGLGGLLSGIKFSLQRLKGALHLSAEDGQSFDRTMDMMDNSINEMRRIAHNMMPESLLKLGLEAALNDFASSLNSIGGRQVVCQCAGLDTTKLSDSEAIAVYRIIQELVNNAYKHANASEVLIQVYAGNDILSLTVEDNGPGFDASVMDERKGMGWNNITSRVAYFKGQIDIKSAVNEGTSVYIEWPRENAFSDAP